MRGRRDRATHIGLMGSVSTDPRSESFDALASPVEPDMRLEESGSAATCDATSTNSGNFADRGVREESSQSRPTASATMEKLELRSPPLLLSVMSCGNHVIVNHTESDEEEKHSPLRILKCCFLQARRSRLCGTKSVSPTPTTGGDRQR